MDRKYQKIIGGHQPNFFPWFGYFEKIIISDIFVFSDDVQYPKRSYVNRVQIPIDNKDKYLSLPVDNSKTFDRIYIKQYIKSDQELKKFIKTLEFNFKKYKYYDELIPIMDFYKSIYFTSNSIAELNILMIKYILEKINIIREIKLGTELGLEKFSLNERIVQRCKKLNMFNYIAGVGSKNYHNEEYFNEEGVNLVYMDYSLTKSIFSENDMKYSILYLIAKYGLEYIKNGVAKYENIIH